MLWGSLLLPQPLTHSRSYTIVMVVWRALGDAPFAATENLIHESCCTIAQMILPVNIAD